MDPGTHHSNARHDQRQLGKGASGANREAESTDAPQRADYLVVAMKRGKAEKVYREIDWPLLVMFVGLFVVVAGLERAVLTPDIIAAVGRLHLGSLPILAVATAALSNLVSNVP